MFCQHLMLEYLTKHLNDMLIHIDFDGEYHCHQQVRARANIEVCFVLVFWKVGKEEGFNEMLGNLGCRVDWHRLLNSLDKRLYVI